MQNFLTSLKSGLPLLLSLLFVSCSSYDPTDHGTMYMGRSGAVVSQGDQRPLDNVSYWDGNNVAGAPRVDINLSEQRAYFYKGSQLVGISLVSTGREGHNTPAGSYKVINKDIDHVSNLWGNFVDSQGTVVVPGVSVAKDKPPVGAKFVGSPMPFFMRLSNGGVGMHAGFLPGYPASAGCIRMPEFMAKNFFYNVSVGTPVTIRY